MALTRCEQCGGTLKRVVLPEYRDARLGLPGLVLVDAVEELRCAKCGAVAGIGFPNLAGLVAAAAVARVLHPAALSGRELRFLRSALDLPARELATAVSVRPETVSRWENDKEPIGPTSEKLIRLLVGLRLGERAHLIPFGPDHIAAMKIHARSARRPVRIRLRLVRVAGAKAGSGGLWDHAREAAKTRWQTIAPRAASAASSSARRARASGGSATSTSTGASTARRSARRGSR